MQTAGGSEPGFVNGETARQRVPGWKELIHVVKYLETNLGILN